MKIRVNGEQTELAAESTILDLLVHLGSDHPGVAVAVDGSVVARSLHNVVELKEGQVVEVVRAVGGG